MSTVLYIDDSPLWLTDIKRNKSYNKIIEGYVVNGDWLLRLTPTTVYAFEEFAVHYGWGDKFVLHNEYEYKTYEEVEVDMSIVGYGFNCNYNEIINMANKIRNANKE